MVTYIKILFFCHWWLTPHYLDTLNTVLSVQILSISNCPGKRHYQNRRISIYSLMTNEKKERWIKPEQWSGGGHMMRSWVERRLSCPSTSVDQRGTELLTQTVKAALKHIYIIFSYYVTLIFSFMPRYMMRNAAFLCPLPWLRLACGVLLRVHASPPLRNYRRAVIQFWNRQYC